MDGYGMQGMQMMMDIFYLIEGEVIKVLTIS